VARSLGKTYLQISSFSKKGIFCSEEYDPKKWQAIDKRGENRMCKALACQELSKVAGALWSEHEHFLEQQAQEKAKHRLADTEHLKETHSLEEGNPPQK